MHYGYFDKTPHWTVISVVKYLIEFRRNLLSDLAGDRCRYFRRVVVTLAWLKRKKRL